jgi:hypothetical protein
MNAARAQGVDQRIVVFDAHLGDDLRRAEAREALEPVGGELDAPADEAERPEAAEVGERRVDLDRQVAEHHLGADRGQARQRVQVGQLRVPGDDELTADLLEAIQAGEARQRGVLDLEVATDPAAGTAARPGSGAPARRSSGRR